MKHVHYDKIVAKAENMKLETFINQDGEWRLMVNAFPMSEHFNYFLCLPQHKEACLHWLNGGSVQVESEPRELNPLTEYCGKFPETNWDKDVWCMHPLSVRIKPKKEKRWIGVYGKHITENHFGSKSEVEKHVNESPVYSNCAHNWWQFIEIEIEVTE